MVVRAVNTCSFLRSAASPPLAALGSHLHQFRPLQCGGHAKLRFRFAILRPDQSNLQGYGAVRRYSVQSLVEMVMEEFVALRKRRKVSASAKYVSNCTSMRHF